MRNDVRSSFSFSCMCVFFSSTFPVFFAFYLQKCTTFTFFSASVHFPPVSAFGCREPRQVEEEAGERKKKHQRRRKQKNSEREKMCISTWRISTIITITMGTPIRSASLFFSLLSRIGSILWVGAEHKHSSCVYVHHVQPVLLLAIPE